jgi:hypothetical protein
VGGSSPLCLAATNNDAHALLHTCGGSDTVWDLVEGPSGHCLIENDSVGTFLSGDNHEGDQFQMLARGVSGAEQQFTLSISSSTGGMFILPCK